MTSRLPLPAALVLAALLLPAGCSGPADRPNVVVIVVDTLRQDHVGAYGYPRDTTPRLDAFADDAMVCRQAYSNCSWTSPAVASLFTGQLPSVHGTVDHYEQKASILAPELQTLAEAFLAHGYRTAAFVANSWLDPALGYDRGFEVFDSINRKQKPRAAELNEKALAWLRDAPAEPFFLYLHYFDVHGPYWAPPPHNKAFRSDSDRILTMPERRALGYLGRKPAVDGNRLGYYIDQYDGEIQYVDHHLGQVLDQLAAAELLEDTIVVITSDHGESFFEHGHCDHGFTVYEPEIAIPLVVRFPAGLATDAAAAALAAGPVQLIDLGPTLLAAAGTRFANGTQGRNLLAGGPPAPVWSEELAPVMKGPPKLALRRGDWKAVFDVESGTLQALFDLAADPGETADLRQAAPDSAAAFAAAIVRHLTAATATRAVVGITGENAPLSDKLQRKLKSLGYVN